MRQIEADILRVLLGQAQPISSEEISRRLGVSSRTVKRHIKDMPRTNGSISWDIDAGPRGYRIAIDSAERRALEGELARATNDDDQIERGIAYELFTHAQVSTDRMSEDLFYSRNVISAHMKAVRAQLQAWNVRVEATPKRGYAVLGSEEDIRRAFSETLDFDDEFVHKALERVSPKLTKEHLTAMTMHVLARYGLRRNEEEIGLFVRHVAASILRSNCGNSLRAGISTLEVPVLQGVEALLEEVSGEFGISFAATEKYYLACILGGNDVSYHEHQLIDLTVERALDCLADSYGAAFLKDQDLRSAVSNHIVGILKLQKLGIDLKNPMCEDIKRTYYVSFGYAGFLCEELEKVLGVSYSEDEIAYIALHFESASERCERSRRYHVVVVCGGGVATSSLVRMKLESRLPMLVIDDVLPSYLVNDAALSGVDFLVSTGTATLSTSKRVVYVSPLVSDHDIDEILAAIRADAGNDYIRGLFSPELFWSDVLQTSRDEVMDFITDRLVAAGVMGGEMRRRAIAREAEPSTEIGSLLAIPHCLTDGPSRIAAVFLHEPILWHHEMVRLVLFGCINPGEEYSKKIYPHIRKRLEGLDFGGKGVSLTFEGLVSRLAG